MSSPVVRLLSPRVAIACAALFALSACERGVEEPNAAAELAWARAALERNPRIEVVASDHQAGVFTVRDKHSGDVQVVKLSEIAAVPLAQLAAASAPAADSQFATEPAVATPQAAAAESAAATDAQAQQVAHPAIPATAAEASNYTIERTDGQLRVTGPGVSIVSSGKPSAGGAQNEPGQHTAEPTICEGRRMLHFDNRNIYVDGDALTVRDGCELFITNSRIVASGTGIVVRDAVVHIANSHIEGAAGSFDADADSKLYVRDSTFQGVSRRDELAMVQDQGGNRWR